MKPRSCALLVVFIHVALSHNDKSETFMLYRARPKSSSSLKALSDLQLNDHLFNIDFWKEPHHVGDIADIMIPWSLKEVIENHFEVNGIDYNITVPDIEKLISRNEGHKSTYGFGKRLNDDPILDSEPDDDWSHVGKLRKAYYPFGDYAPYADMIKFMRTIEFYYPRFTRIIRIGTTHEGLPIEGLKIGYPIDNTNKRAIYIDGNIHAREWASSHTALFIINQLVSGYGKDENITFYVNNLNFYIVPCLNADGYEYTRSSPAPLVRLWRKNRSPEVCSNSLWGGERCCRGVDLNRNFDHFWSETGSSFERCSNLFHGENVFSEPEAAAVRKLLESDELWGKTDAFLTLHTYAQLWIYPYSHKETTFPRDIEDLRKVARKAVHRLENVYGTVYRTGTGADTLTPASGGSDDWAKSKMHIKYVFLIELRPEEHLSHGFILHKKELIPTGVETFEGIKEVIEGVLIENNIKRDPLARITLGMKRKQDLRRRLMAQYAFRSIRTMDSHDVATLVTTRARTNPTMTTRLTTTTMTTSPTTMTTISTEPSTTTAQRSLTPTTQETSTMPSTIFTSSEEPNTAFYRPKAPTAPPVFDTTQKALTAEEERKRKAKQREREERKKEVEETRRRVKAIEERKRKEAELGFSIDQNAHEEHKDENIKRLKAQREEADQQKEHQRLLEKEKKKVDEEQRERDRLVIERELQREKESHNPTRIVKKMQDGHLIQAEAEVLEAQPETSTPIQVIVLETEITLSPPIAPITAYSPYKIPVNAVTQVYAKDDSTVSNSRTTSDNLTQTSLKKIIPKTRSTFAPPRITQRLDRRFTTIVPVAFRDPTCRDLRYSCGFWLKTSPQACTEQHAFMKAQCSYTCKFCEASPEIYGADWKPNV